MTTANLPSILFVDDEPQVRNALKRSLHQFRNQWQLHFCGSGQEALDILAKQSIDIIITDMKMPVMDGATLLNRVQEISPNTTRIMLTGNADAEVILKSVQSIHTLLSKPTPTELIIATIERSLQLKETLSDTALQSLVSQIGSLPSQPAMYNKIKQQMSSDSGSLEQVGKLIAQDIGITSKILQVVNSPFFGLKKEVISVEHAIAYLGFEMVQNLVLASELFESFRHAGVDASVLEDLWDHAQKVSQLAGQIARLENLPASHCNTVITGGLLHDIGKLVLLLYSPEQYRTVEELVANGELRQNAEKSIFGAQHAAVGAYLISLWGLPTSLVECIFFHHDEQLLDQSPLLTPVVVYIADCLIRGQQDQLSAISGVDEAKLQQWQDLLEQQAGTAS